MIGLAKFLRENRDKIVKKEKFNIVREEVGYSEYTRWMTTVSFDEIEVIDFDLLMTEIEKFEKVSKRSRKYVYN